MPGGDIINLFDFKAGKGLTLTPSGLTAIRLDITHMPKAMPKDMLSHLKELQETPSKDLGEKEINGRKLHGFFSTETQNETTTQTTVWADPKSKMPIIVEETIRNGFMPMTITMSDFEWNSTIDDSLLKLEIPPGYSVSDAPLDMGKPTEKELVDALKASTHFNNGKFPAGLPVRRLAQSLFNTLSDKSQIEQKMREHGGDMLIVARGWAYITNPENGSDWHWAGTDIPLNEKDRPILWYKPHGKSTYTIFDADLTVHTAAEEPAVPSIPIDITPADQPIK